MDKPICGAVAVPVQGQAEPRYICPDCGDVTDEMSCPQATPEKDRSGLDI